VLLNKLINFLLTFLSGIYPVTSVKAVYQIEIKKTQLVTARKLKFNKYLIFFLIT